MSFLRIWGCESHVKKLTSDKLAPKTDKCLFVGYPKETKGYYFYNPSENKVFVARKAVLLEKEFVSKKNSGSKIQLEEVQDPQILEEDSMKIESESQGVVETEPIAQEPQRSGRIRHEPERYGFLITDNPSIVLVDQDEPTFYQRLLNLQTQPNDLEP